MREDIVPTLRKTPGLNFSAYISDLLDRFRNPALTHKLIQIASDGSQKLPYRILGSLQDALKGGRNIRRFTISLGAWMRFVERQAKAGIAIQDPMNDILTEIGKACTGVAVVDTPKFLALREVFPAELAESAQFQAAIVAAYENFEALLD